MAQSEQTSLFAAEIVHIGTDPNAPKHVSYSPAPLREEPVAAAEALDSPEIDYRQTADFALAETLLALSRGRSAQALGAYARVGATPARYALRELAEHKGLSTAEAAARVDGTAHDERTGIAAMHYDQWRKRIDPNDERDDLPTLTEIERHYYTDSEGRKQRQQLLRKHRQALASSASSASKSSSN